MKKALSNLLCSVGFCVLLGLTSTFGQTPTPSPPKEVQLQEADRVHFGDLIDVDFVGGFEFDWRGTLTPEGYLDGLDSFNDRIYALCRSESDVAADVSKVYSKILREPKVVVKILDRSNRAIVRLDGAVRFPQRFQIKRLINLRELLVIAGGITDDAGGEVAIFRPQNLSCGDSPSTTNGAPQMAANSSQGNGSQVLNIRISELLSGIAAANPLILSGDVITVIKAVPIYVIGAVTNPRQIYSRSEITISRAIASAGGLAKEAIGENVTIFRRDGDKTHVIEVDLGKIKTGEISDEVLKPFDIIEVPRKGGGNRKYPPVVALGESKGKDSPAPPLRIID